MVGNVWIVYMHCTTPPHPKFKLLPIRTFGIRLHLLSGTTEIIVGLLCWFWPDSALMVKIMAIASCCHCFSGFLLTPIVFGIQIITVPGYTFCITIKVIQAVNVFCNPDCYIRVLCLILTHTIYAYFRLTWGVCKSCDVLEDHAYTISLLMSGSIVFPLMGPWVLMALFGYIGA